MLEARFGYKFITHASVGDLPAASGESSAFAARRSGVGDGLRLTGISPWPSALGRRMAAILWPLTTGHGKRRI
jgi:hypothetical protein